MYQLAVVYDSGKRYIIPFDILSDFLSEEDIDKIKTQALKEVSKL